MMMQVLQISAVGAAGAFLMYAGYRYYRLKRLIEDIPTSKIRSIAMGLVEIKGKAEPAVQKIRESPFSGRKCVYYEYSILRHEQRSRNSRWVAVKSGKTPDPFFVKDNTGKVLVDPKFASVILPESYSSVSSARKDPDPMVKEFLRKEKVRFEGSFFGINYPMKYSERIIPVGMEIYVMGTADDNPYVEEGTAEHGVDDIIIKKGKDNMMIISDKHEKKITGRYMIGSLLFFIAGFAIFMFGMASLIFYMIANISVFG